jgi:H+/Cl- antiporter ClcA
LSENGSPKLGDFTTSLRVIPISILAIVIGVISSFVALALLRLIGLFTNLFYFQRWSSALVSPAGNHLGYWAVLVPVIGALVIGLMARYGSERIRGHGIPEARAARVHKEKLYEIRQIIVDDGDIIAGRTARILRRAP